jgi:hypothetical protein
MSSYAVCAALFAYGTVRRVVTVLHGELIGLSNRPFKSFR